jgi:hypothetical protein
VSARNVARQRLDHNTIAPLIGRTLRQEDAPIIDAIWARKAKQRHSSRLPRLLSLKFDAGAHTAVSTETWDLHFLEFPTIPLL